MARMLTRSDLTLTFGLSAKTPLLTAMAVLSLAVGLGLTAGAFTIMRQILYSDLPFADGERIVLVREQHDWVL